MRDARHDGAAGYRRVRLTGLRTYWLGVAFAVVLFGGGIAGLSLGHPATGTIGLILGGIVLLAGLRDQLRPRRPARAGRTPDALR
jgi:hypothetical protein